jgi:uncharacterized membrane protein YgcG
MSALFPNLAFLARRMDDSRGGGMGLFLILVMVGIVAFLVLRGRRDRAEQLGEAARPLPSGPVQGHAFPCPYPRCPACGAAGDKMKQAWDGLRKVTWTCGYCGAVAGIQELKDEDLPPGARHRLGLDPQPPAADPGQPAYYPPQGGGGMGGLLTGMMIGSMLGGERRPSREDGAWPGGDGGGDLGDPAQSGHDWGEGSGSGGDWGDSGGGGDWGDSGGGDSGGGNDF